MKTHIKGFPDITIEVLTVNGAEVLRIDLNSYDGERFDKLLEFTGALIRSNPPGSVRLLTVMHPDTPMLTDKKHFSGYLQKNKPYIKASAYCGFPRILLPMMKSSLDFSGRNDIRFFDNEQDAVNWLVSK
jgi:hypothetical protein